MGSRPEASQWPQMSSSNLHDRWKKGLFERKNIQIYNGMKMVLFWLKNKRSIKESINMQATYRNTVEHRPNKSSIYDTGFSDFVTGGPE